MSGHPPPHPHPPYPFGAAHPLAGGDNGHHPAHANNNNANQFALYHHPHHPPHPHQGGGPPRTIFHHPTARVHHPHHPVPVGVHHHAPPRGKRLPPRPQQQQPFYQYGAEPVDVAAQALQGLQQPPRIARTNDEEQDEDNDEDEEDENVAVPVGDQGATGTKKRKKDWRDYPRYEFNKNPGRKRLKAARDALAEAKDALASSKIAYEHAVAHEREQQAQYALVSEQVIDDLLEKEAPRPWNKMYKRIKAFYEKHGHVILSTRASTAKRKLVKDKQKKLRIKEFEDHKQKQKRLSEKDQDKGEEHPALGEDQGKANETSAEVQAKDLSENEQDAAAKDPPGSKTADNEIEAPEEPANDNAPVAAAEEEDDDDDDEDVDVEEIGALGRWSALQRTARKKGKLEDWKVGALNRLEFAWDARDVTWNTTYQELKQYHEVHGHINVLPGQNSSLNRWLRFQRDNYRDYKNNNFQPAGDSNNGMTAKRCELLEALGMDWKGHDERWIVLFHKLQKLVASQGHLRKIPAKLESFVEKQRQAYKQFMKDGSGELTPERVLLLESIEFPWTENGEHDAADEGAKGGPKKFLSGTPIVAAAIQATKLKQQQQQQEQQQKAQQQQLQQQKSAPVSDEEWMQNYLKVKAFFAQHHHFNYADQNSQLSAAEVKKMQQWDRLQRRKYKKLTGEHKSSTNSPLTKEQVELLGVLGFFQPNEDREAAYQMAILRRFHAAKGDALVTYSDAYPDNPLWQKLADWAHKQREEYRRYTGMQVVDDGDSNSPKTIMTLMTAATTGLVSPNRPSKPISLTWDRVYEMTLMGFNWALPPPPKRPTTSKNTSPAGADKPPKRATNAKRAAPPADAATGENPPKRKRGRPRKHPLPAPKAPPQAHQEVNTAQPVAAQQEANPAQQEAVPAQLEAHTTQPVAVPAQPEAVPAQAEADATQPERLPAQPEGDITQQPVELPAQPEEDKTRQEDEAPSAAAI